MFKDKKLNKIYQQVTKKFGPLAPIQPAKESEYFQKLSHAVIGQQLSNKVAPVITDRVHQVVGKKLTPQNILETSHEKLRSAGLSNSKANYIRNIAEAWRSGSISSKKLTKMPDQEVIETLVKIKGIGEWTAEMFLIFSLGRPDVFSVGDYGLRQAVNNIYGFDPKKSKEKFLEIEKKWQPNRSLASRILWKSLEL